MVYFCTGVSGVTADTVASMLLSLFLTSPPQQLNYCHQPTAVNNYEWKPARLFNLLIPVSGYVLVDGCSYTNHFVALN